MKINDIVYHKINKQIGIVCEIGRRGAFVNWSDHTGVCFRWAKLTDLEVINESR